MEKDPERIGRDFVADVEACWGDDLVAVVLYGSAARADYVPGRSDLNFLVLVTGLEPERLMVFVPSAARPGDTIPVTISVFDGMGNSGIPFSGEVALNALREGLQLPEKVAFLPHHEGRLQIRVRVDNPGVYRVVALGRGYLEGLAAESNPLIVRQEVARQLWGDLHGHSNFSDGTGLPEDFFLYARDAAGLDFAALTDHVIVDQETGKLTMALNPDDPNWPRGATPVAMCEAADPNGSIAGGIWAVVVRPARPAATTASAPASAPSTAAAFAPNEARGSSRAPAVVTWRSSASRAMNRCMICVEPSTTV